MNTFQKELQEIKRQYDAGTVADKIQKYKNEWGDKPVILYGAGTLSGFVMEHLKNHDVMISGFADTFRSGVHKTTGLPIISAQELKENYSDAVVIVTSELHGKSIRKTLKEIEYPGMIYSFEELLSFYTIPYEEFVPHIEGYEWIYNYYTDEVSKKIVIDSIKTRILGTQMTPSSNAQYFEPDICPLSDQEVFVDGGCFIGDTAEEFIRQTNGKYNHIYGFEPDRGNIQKAIANLSSYPNIDIMCGGLWHVTNTVKFVSGQFGNSRITEEGDEIVKTYGLDNFFADKEITPTFIKMDIEGAERTALDGTASILKELRPKLAICVYHNIQDMYDIPRRILYHNPEYKLALRHYSSWYAESVCYAL